MASQPSNREGCPPKPKARLRRAMAKAGVYWRGAIAQLGERLLCKQEVVGSIPSGSTSGDPVVLLARLVRENESAHRDSRPSTGGIAFRVLSDIVKRRSFRANVKRRQAVTCARAPTSLFAGCFLHPSEAVARILKSVKLDRLTVGAILKQAGLSNQCPAERVDAGTQVLANYRSDPRRVGWALIMRAIKCRKGIWWMPWR